ncbi:ATP-binding protein [Paracoccus binzhouensis]|uniref:ATP-binding protein n=1 Tax=Paracoccus binzhouensis TaxID=2796149 RepID=UPI0018EF2C76|nr:adenylate/guanylate cyclase domain-containing protein [Paracoccus binzhouensis]
MSISMDDAGAAPFAVRDEDADWSEYRPVSAMFVDLVGSAELIGKLGPERYNAALRAFHNLVTAHVRLLGGEVVQYLGDGVMCLFHRGHEEMGRAAAAIAAGLRIAGAIQRPGSAFPANVRIGIASGLALFSDGASAAGVRAVGHCINLAARLQAVAPPGSVLVCAESRRSAQELFAFRALPDQPLKGFAEAVSCWEAAEPRGERAENPRSPLVGRLAEISALESALAEAIAGRGQTVAVMGEAGFGKTRLLEEFAHSPLAQSCQRLVLNCRRDERGGDFHPIKAHLLWVAGVAMDDDEHRREAKLRQMFGAVWGLEGTAIDDLLVLLDAHSDADRQLSTDPVLLRRWLCEQLTSRILELQGVSPALIVVVEDAHWLDPSSLEFLAGFQAVLRDRPILMLFSQRTAGSGDQPVLAADRALRLEPLSRAQSQDLIRSLLNARAGDAEMVRWVQDKARGVPLYVTAFADYALRKERADFGAPDLPLDLLDVIEESLGRLPERTRRFAQAAAVMGPHFEPAIIAALLGESGEDTCRHVDRLVTEKLAAERVGILGMAFAHDLVREAIYGNLGSDLRRRLHADLAAVIEARWPEVPAHFLALHFENGGQPEQALRYLINATLASVRVGALQEARDHIGRAFALLPRLSGNQERRRQELALYSLEGPLQMILGGPGNAAFGDAQRRSMDLMRELGLNEDRAHLYYNSGLHDWACCRLDAAETTARTVLALPNEGEGAQLAGHTLAGLVAWHKGDLGRARHHLGRTIALYRPEKHAPLFSKYLKDFGVFSLFYSGLTASVAGEFDAAEGFATRAVELGRSLGIAHARGFSLLAMFLTEMFRGDPETTVAHAKEAETLARTHHFPEFLAMAGFAQGWALTRQPATRTEGIATMIDGLEGWRRTNFIAWQSLFEAMVIEELVKAGEPSRAQAYLPGLKTRLAQSGEAQFLAPALIAEAQLLAAQDQPQAAQASLAQAWGQARAMRAHLWLTHAERAGERIGWVPA